MPKVRSICIEFIQNVMKTSVAARKDDTLTVTIIVTKANEMLGEIHDRMPVILDPDDVKPWLNGALGSELLEPALEDKLICWSVSTRVNKAGSADDRSLIEPIEVS
jgi:putative SOS response-associated peptidase YedK